MGQQALEQVFGIGRPFALLGQLGHEVPFVFGQRAPQHDGMAIGIADAGHFFKFGRAHRRIAGGAARGLQALVRLRHIGHLQAHGDLRLHCGHLQKPQHGAAGVDIHIALAAARGGEADDIAPKAGGLFQIGAGKDKVADSKKHGMRW